MSTIRRSSLTRSSLLVAPLAALLGLALASSAVLAVDGPTKFTFGPFQNFFEVARPYVMVGFLALGLWALIHNFGRALTGTLKSRPDGTALTEHRVSIGRLLELALAIVVLEALIYGALWHGLDLFGTIINLFQQASSTPPVN